MKSIIYKQSPVKNQPINHKVDIFYVLTKVPHNLRETYFPIIICLALKYIETVNIEPLIFYLVVFYSVQITHNGYPYWAVLLWACSTLSYALIITAQILSSAKSGTYIQIFFFFSSKWSRRHQEKVFFRTIKYLNYAKVSDMYTLVDS